MAPVIIEKTFNADIERVWNAITDRDQMQQWYFNIADFKPEVGFEFTFEGSDECRTYIHLCRVTRVIKNKLLEYTWKYEGYEGTSIVTFELSEGDHKTHLNLTHAGLETFPQNEKSFARSSFEEGWTHIITKSLSEYLEKVTT
jgi:uncharacterized protein YndB with AHSA1/START domain